MASAEDSRNFEHSVSYVSNIGGYRTGIQPAPASDYISNPAKSNMFQDPPVASRTEDAGAGISAGKKGGSILDIIKADAVSHKNTVTAAALILLIASGFFFYSSIKALFLLSAFVAIGAVSRMWQRFFPLSFGVELVMLFTVLSAAIYGPLAGLLVGFFALSISTLITQEDIAKMWPSFIAIAAVGYIAGSASVANIAMWGLGLTVLYDAIISLAYVYMGHSIIKTLIFDATHIAFNYFVFFNLAPNLVGLLV